MKKIRKKNKIEILDSLKRKTNLKKKSHQKNLIKIF